MPTDLKNKYPEINIEEIRLRGIITSVETALPAFIGYTAKAEKNGKRLPLFKPYKIHNILEYEQSFGAAELQKNLVVNISRQKINGMYKISSAVADFKPGTTASLHNMYYSIKFFFDNGGRSCLIVPVGKTASSKQINVDLIEKGLNALEAFSEPTLLLFPEGQGIIAASAYYGLIQKAIQQASTLKDRFVIFDLHQQFNTTYESISNFRSTFKSPEHPEYSAAYYPNLKTNYKFDYQDANVRVIISTDGDKSFNGKLSILKSGAGPDVMAYTAAKDAIAKIVMVLPASPAIAGIYAEVDSRQGVWKSPANVVVKSAIDLTDQITEQEQASMNVDPAEGKSVNAIRFFAGRGILVFGARTLNGNNNEWRYICVRRFCTMIEESVKQGVADNIFKPNTIETWISTRANIENFLISIWRHGALIGATSNQAFFVRCGLNQTMTAEDVLEGRLNVQIGLAVIRPAEFVILSFTQQLHP